MRIARNYKRFILTCCISVGGLALCATLFNACDLTNLASNSGSDGSLEGGDADFSSPSSASANCSSSNEKSEALGGGNCVGNTECEEQCDDLFSSGSDQGECKELSVNEVSDLFNTFDEDQGLLANPDYEARREEDELSEVCVDSVEKALTIDDDYLDNIYDGYGQGEARDILLWFAQNDSISGAIDRGVRASGGDSDDVEDSIKKLLKTLLEKTGGSDSVLAGLREGLDKEEDNIEDNTFFAYATNGNLPKKTITWVLELASEECPGDETAKSKCLAGEIFCTQSGSTYLFEDESVLGAILDLENDVEDYFETLVDNEDIDDAEVVCPAFCVPAAGNSSTTACP